MYGEQQWRNGVQAPYGSVENQSTPHKGRKLNRSAVFWCWLIPVLVFTIICGLLSSSLRANQPLFVNLAMVVVLLCALICVYLAVHMIYRWRRGTVPEFPYWYAYMASGTVLALFSSIAFAHLNYSDNVYAYENLSQLAFAKNVDPAVDASTRFMDAGRVEFVEGTTLALEKYIGFKNSDVYCVAPIVHDATSSKSLRSAPGAIYDYWAVGLNCCSAGAYKCGEYANPNARSGVRLLREEQRAFYALAVQEAQATYGLKVNHPLFFEWVQDSEKFQQSWMAEAAMNWLLASATFAAFMLGLTVAAVVLFVKLFFHHH